MKPAQLMMTFGEQVVAEAREWVGTPAHWQASVKGVGCDCKGLIAGGMAELGLSPWLQFVIFAASSIALPLLFRRPLLARFAGRGVPSRTDALLGESAVVLEAIDPVHLTGRVSLHGQDWMARASVPLAKGRTATVVGADGIVLLVEPAEHTSLS